MRAHNWEFKYRALVFGLIFGLGFSAYSIDPQNSTTALANRLAPLLGMTDNGLARLLLAFAAYLLFVAALVRTWASSHLHATVVYAADVKTETLVADGPYRHVRNPLYFANVLMAIGLGAMMSRLGFFVTVAAMIIFCYRLILREESDLHIRQGDPYQHYRNAVPRLRPSLRPRLPSAGRQARWREGFRAEFWNWGFGAAVAAFAITLSSTAFFAILAGSIFLLWLSTRAIQTP